MSKKSVILTAAIVAMIAIVGVGDQTLGISPACASTCSEQCSDKYKACKVAEDARDKAATRACGTDQACLNAEKRLHQANLNACKQALNSCKQGCS